LPQVRGDALYHVTPPDFPNLFFHLFDSAGVEQSLPPRRACAHSRGDILGCEEVGIRANLIVQFAFSRLFIE
jgi:hypothetical protein